MTSFPSKIQTGFCSPSSTRSFGATPFARSSFNWSVMYSMAFCFDVIVAVSDMMALLTWTRLVEELFCVSSRLESKRLEGYARKALRSVRHPVWVQQNLSGQATLKQGKGVFEFVQRGALAKERLQVQPSCPQQCRHLHPRLVHAPPVDALHRRALENHVVHQIQRHVLRRNPQQGSSPARSQRLKALLNRGG